MSGRRRYRLTIKLHSEKRMRASRESDQDAHKALQTARPLSIGRVVYDCPGKRLDGSFSACKTASTSGSGVAT